MMPPPGCTDEPHIQRSLDGRPEARPAGHRPVDEQLLERQLALEDVALGETHGALDVERRQHLAVQDQAPDVRRPFGEGVDDGVAEGLALLVPGALGQLVRRVLDEAAHDVLAGRRHARVDQGGDDHVDIGARD